MVESGSAFHCTIFLGTNYFFSSLVLHTPWYHKSLLGNISGYESGGDGIHVNPERSFGGTNGEPPIEASQLRKGGPGVLPRKISKTYMANGAIYVIPELYL